MTDWPAPASARSPSNVDRRVTVLVRPDGRTLTVSPGRTVPPTIMPAKPRKSRSGRLTHCTGIRNGPLAASSWTSTDSRCASNGGPVYHGVCSLGSVTLSPTSADTGMQVMSESPMPAAKAR